ncbi:hypothetical protein DAETH_43570 (plasmid) [Deinococcus aetherius]|uniref:DUF11 domain-containing protein n=1 Tax=Deinococcus aetherius TaxID=200252 RepID=A0ABM8AKP0_9DEIO|nr:hypothetical protein [Deinococcus aetherius]BDP44388.1 hypothetical protein DAETH_43570 [Deinococcus aetherius]
MKKLLATTLALATFSVFSQGLAVGTAANTAISNTGYLDLNDGVNTTTLQSTPVVVNVTQVYGVTVTPDGTTAAPGQNVTLFPGQTGILTYTLTNTGNGTDSFNVAAATANATAQGANILGVYLDNPTTGTVGSYDAGDTLVTSVASLAADATRTLFVRYSLPSGTTGGSASGAAHQLNLSGTSAGDTTKTDTNNVGQFTVGRVIDLTLASTQTKTVAPNGTVTFTDTLTNTGNTTLTAADITATVTAAATNAAGASITNGFTTTYTVGGTTGNNLDTLIKSAVGTGLTAGGSLTITVNVAAPSTPADKDQQALSITAYSPTTGAGVTNNAPSTDPQGQIVNTTVVARGVGSVTKTVAYCGSAASSCPVRTAATAGPVSAKPGEYVVYYLEATNTGTGTLTNVRLRDVLPANFVATSVGATTSATGTLKFSTDGTTWVGTPVGLTLTGGTSTLYVAVENGGTASTIDTSDTFPAAGTLRLKIAGYVRSDSTTTTTITRDDSGL